MSMGLGAIISCATSNATAIAAASYLTNNDEPEVPSLSARATSSSGSTASSSIGTSSSLGLSLEIREIDERCKKWQWRGYTSISYQFTVGENKYSIRIQIPILMTLLFCLFMDLVPPLLIGADSSQSLVRGLVLLNCAGGMNNKAIVDD
ncbi:hypothetical protein RHSIM_Rhsim05G0000400 [Rhododendron simsii]|uniref:Uncharacterized protein n=1 Tax=Rhododendron simsii TaxID=118357 RepID=A0A834GY48_RHOSS|nr:hypothetical protein RHSIM_Rhsim05G0000400 [Rhododendron simsii]